MASHLLDTLFLEVAFGDASDLRTFFRTWGPRHADDPVAQKLAVTDEGSETPFMRLVRVALRADRRSAATIAGHQASLRRLFPDLPEAAVVAFCVSEEGGAHPKGIQTRLEKQGDGLVLHGSKKWGTLSPDSDLLMVAASVGWQDGRNQLRMVQVPADREGVVIEPMPTHSSVPELRHADLTFTGVEIAETEVLPGDAYDTAIKPFRMVEDTFNTTGIQIGLFALGRRLGWDEEVLEDLLAAILQAEALSRTGMETPAEILAITAYLRNANAIWERLGPCWQKTSPEIAARWSPETGLLGVAAKARELRRRSAWSALNG